jgi:hypothetical protein
LFNGPSNYEHFKAETFRALQSIRNGNSETLQAAGAMETLLADSHLQQEVQIQSYTNTYSDLSAGRST